MALAYADRFPDAVAALVLRGAFLTGFDDVQALFNARGAGRDMLVGGNRQQEGFPAARGRLHVVSKLLQAGTAVQKLNTAIQWQLAERRLLGLPAMDCQTWRQQIAMLRKYQIQAHYLCRRAGLGKSALLRAAARIGVRGVPVTLLHGRADRICHPGNAQRLQAVMPQARLVWLPGGHLGEGGMAQALGAAIRAARWSVGTRRQPAGFLDPAIDGIA